MAKRKKASGILGPRTEMAGVGEMPLAATIVVLAPVCLSSIHRRSSVPFKIEFSKVIEIGPAGIIQFGKMSTNPPK